LGLLLRISKNTKKGCWRELGRVVAGHDVDFPWGQKELGVVAGFDDKVCIGGPPCALLSVHDCDGRASKTAMVLTG
jgi:hypothetical protein